jgi:hypothetical protein
MLRAHDWPLYWHGNKDGTERLVAGEMVGWLVNVEFGVSSTRLRSMADFAARVIRDRLKGMAMGDEKDALTRAVALLEEGRLRQNMIVDEKVLFDAYKKDESSPIYSFPGRPQ